MLLMVVQTPTSLCSMSVKMTIYRAEIEFSIMVAKITLKNSAGKDIIIITIHARLGELIVLTRYN